jgi:hypothetical protein
LEEIVLVVPEKRAGEPTQAEAPEGMDSVNMLVLICGHAAKKAALSSPENSAARIPVGAVTTRKRIEDKKREAEQYSRPWRRLE